MGKVFFESLPALITHSFRFNIETGEAVEDSGELLQLTYHRIEQQRYEELYLKVLELINNIASKEGQEASDNFKLGSTINSLREGKEFKALLVESILKLVESWSDLEIAPGVPALINNDHVGLLAEFNARFCMEIITQYKAALTGLLSKN